MTEPCAFCEIVRGEAWASRVYEDDEVIAFLSNRPVNPSHTLVVPKKHYRDVYEIPEQEVAHLYTIVKKVALAVRSAVNPEGIRIVQNNGEAAGQVIFHLHVHIIPMYKAPLTMLHGEAREASALENDAKRIKQFL
jgi:histidine triad (HIT) family protein